MKINTVFISAFCIALASVLIFILVPNSIYFLAFSGNSFFSGEFWRLVTFSFTHVNVSHLIENGIALFLVSFLGYEFGLKGRQFLIFFFSVSFIVALTDAFLYPWAIIAGASLGIYGVLGALSLHGSPFISRFYLVPLLGLSVFIKALLGFFSCSTCVPDLSQTVFHFSGFLAGIFLFYAPRIFKKKKYILNR